MYTNHRRDGPPLPEGCIRPTRWWSRVGVSIPTLLVFRYNELMLDMSQLQGQATSVAERMIADRAMHDLYYLCKYILGGEEVLDPRVHGPLCRATRPLLFYKTPEEVLNHNYPSDWGREEDEGLPTEEEKQKFLEWQEQFKPQPDGTLVVEDKFDINLTDLLALMPRGTLKSTVLTIGFTIQFLLKYPNARVLIDSETFTKSCAFLAEIKGHYEKNPKLRRIFYTLFQCMPDDNRRSDTWSTTAINLACRTRVQKEPSIDTCGIDTTKNGMHYDLGMLDDLHSEKNTKNAEQIQQVKDHRKLVYSLLDPGAPCAVIGTRWDDDDAYQEIMDTQADDFNFITRKAEADDGTEFYPKRLPQKILKRFRAIQGAYIYSCQYLNNPVDNATSTFKREQFKYIKKDELADIPINWYGIVDPSYTKPGTSGVQSDYAVLMIAGMGPRREIYVRHIHRAKMSYSEIIDKMYEIDSAFTPLRWSLEVIGTKTLEHDLERAQEKAGLEGRKRLRVSLVRSRPNAKEDRIRALSPHYERGDAYHVLECPEIKVLEAELLRFPKSKNDDVSDTLSDILNIGSPPRGDALDEKRSQKRKNYLTMLKKPRSPMVGT